MLMKPPLVEREGCIRAIRIIFDDRTQAFLSKGQSRESYRMPVLVGIPGIGKSRLQNEYHNFFPSEDDSMLVAVFVVYNNGHSLQEADKVLNINTTLAVRMLHAFFQENLTSDAIEFSEMMESVIERESFFADLTIAVACKVIRTGLEQLGKLKSGDRMRLYLAVDDYQAINENKAFPECKLSGEGLEQQTKLGQLCQILVDASLELMQHNICLYPIFAGVEWGKTKYFGSSNPLLAKVTPGFLSISGSYQIAASLCPQGLRSSVFVNCYVEVGDIPRLAVRFLEDGKRLPGSSEDILSLRSSILTNHGIGQSDGLLPQAQLKLIAFAIVGGSVDPTAESVIEQLTWEQLANRGIIQISSDRINVCYAFLFRFCQPETRREFQECSNSSSSLAQFYLWNALRHVIVELPDARDLESWQKWERFGAYYHAIRINSLLVLGANQVKLQTLFNNSSIPSSLRGRECCLRPAQVFMAHESISADFDLTRICEKDNETYHVNAFDQNCCYVICNGTNGAGVDIWFALSRAHGSHQVFDLFADQRKLDCRPLTTKLLQDLDQKLKQCVGARPGIKVISVICSATSSFGKKMVTFPSDCIALGRTELSIYHGPLSRCAASFTLVNINVMSQTWMQTNLGCSKDQAAAIKKMVKCTPFLKLSEFMTEFHRITAKDLPDEIRERLLLVDDVTNKFSEDESDSACKSDEAQVVFFRKTQREHRSVKKRVEALASHGSLSSAAEVVEQASEGEPDSSDTWLSKDEIVDILAKLFPPAREEWDSLV
eukprot:gene24696-29842_t